MAEFLDYSGLKHIIEISKKTKAFASPQMYGAKGDGKTDDTDAINKCIENNRLVVIPGGTYLVSGTIKILTKNRCTVFCANKTIIKASRSLQPVIEFGVYDGWEWGEISWFGGTIDCGNFDNSIGVRCTRRSTGAYIDNIIIRNIGSNGIGMGICDNDDKSSEYASIQLHLGRIKISSHASPDNYTPNKITTGMLIKAYDFQIDDLLITGCTYGLYIEHGSLIHINAYHYWIGCSALTPINYSNYLKTRGLICNESVDFNLLYIDMPYVMTSGTGSISSTRTHFIGIKKEYISNAKNNDINCYVHELNGKYGDIDYGLTTVNYNNIEMNSILNTSGLSVNSFVYNHSITCDYKYTTEAYLKPCLIYNICNKSVNHTVINFYNMIPNTMYLLGYVPKTPGKYNINLMAHNFGVFANFELEVYVTTCNIKNCTYYSSVGGGAITVGFGNEVLIDGFQMFPVCISVEKGTIPLLSMNVKGLGAFYITKSNQIYDGTIKNKVIGTKYS